MMKATMSGIMRGRGPGYPGRAMTGVRAGDRRRNPRFHPKRSAALRIGGQREPVACALLDISLTGARFETTRKPLRDEFSRAPVEVELDGMLPLRAWPVWSRKGQIGVRFMTSSFGKHGATSLSGASLEKRYEQRERFIEQLTAFAAEGESAAAGDGRHSTLLG